MSEGKADNLVGTDYNRQDDGVGRKQHEFALTDVWESFDKLSESLLRLRQVRRSMTNEMHVDRVTDRVIALIKAATKELMIIY